MYTTWGVLAMLALYVRLAHSFSSDVSAPHQEELVASEGGTATLRYMSAGNPPKITRQFPQLGLFLQDKNSALPTEKPYYWVHEEFTPCSATCGGGFQTRNVTCRSREELEIVDASLCDDGLRPPTNQFCSPNPCLAQWVEGPWGECSQRCGSGGVKSREVTCQKIIAYGIKSVVPDKECFDLLGPKPEVFQKCNEDAPCPKWFVGHWRPCDQLCDEGKQTRQVVCHQKKNGRIEVLGDGNCTEAKPEEEKPCMVRPCDGVDWVTTSWSGCDSCTSKYRTRLVVCSTKSRQVLSDNLCSYHDRPRDHEECNKDELPDCEVQWYASQWSKCSVNCGDGVQTRKVFCGMYYNDKSGEGMKVVEDGKCANLTKYNDTKPCTVPKEKCPSRWFAGPWTACTATCGGGEQYRRVMCYRGDQAALCDGATVLDPTRLCNTQPCGEFLSVSRTSTVAMDDEEEYCDDEDSEKIGLDLTTDGITSESPGAIRTNSTSTVFVPPKRVCKPRWEPMPSLCNETTFGCCPDQKRPASGPFEEGCDKPPTCKTSPHGCCPDGLSPAQGENNEGCPREPCADTLFGCCSSDNTTAAQGDDQDGCPPICASSKYGCCADNDTEAAGPEKEGCPATELVEPAKCTDLFFNCDLFVRSKLCRHNDYSKFCCQSCVEAGQLDPQEVELQADQPLRKN